MSPRKPSREATPVFSEYAYYYDILHQDKNYPAEAAFVSRLVKKFAGKSKKELRLLDLACGTGRHCVELSRLGYNVEGSDLSKEMINVAQKEIKKRRLKIPFYNYSFQKAAGIRRRYDVILSMFASIGYLTTYQEIKLAFSNICMLLNDDGCFIFDFWNGNATVRNFSPVRIKKMARGDMEVLRVSETRLEQHTQTANLKFHFLLMKKGMVFKEFEEKHVVRYFFLREMADLLQANGLEVVFRCPFLHETKKMTPSDWYVTYVARKIHSAKSSHALNIQLP